jgi:hypothetical protein
MNTSFACHPDSRGARLDLMDIDWNAWKPGDSPAVAGAGDRLRELAAAAHAELPMSSARVDEVSAILEATLAAQALAGPVTYSVQSLAAQLVGVLDDPADATPVAHTLMTLAQSAAAIAGYLESGVTQVVWSAARDSRVCPDCRANASAGPLPIGQPFPSGGILPPGCQGCRCALLPGRTAHDPR